MKKEIIISESNDLAVVFEDGRAAEFFLRHGDQLVGDIIWGQVEAVVPGIEAAFVNIGQDRNGFIHVADLPSAQTPRRQAAPKRPPIRVRERILVQIAKAPTGTKGARLTGRLTIPGRFLVLVPHDNRVSISRRITDTSERERLRRLTLKLKDPGHGLIVRTEAIDRSEDDLRQDIEELIDIWADILHQVQIVNPPALLHRDSDLIHRVLRDATTGDVSIVVVDNPTGHAKAREILSGWLPELARHVVQHKGPQSIMARYRISEELEAAISPKVWLPSGGYLVIEHTEALTVIDVNSGRLTQSRSLADTVLRTNIEAAAEVGRQLRLRDIGGIVVIDFISMDDPKDRNKVLKAFEEALKQDKSRPQMTNFSEHGLIEVSRRRQGQNLLEQLTTPCEVCGGSGRIRHSHLLPGTPGATLDDEPRIHVSVAPTLHEATEIADEFDEEDNLATEVMLGGGNPMEDEGDAFEDGATEVTFDEEGAAIDPAARGEAGRRRRRRRGRGRGRGRGEEGNGAGEGREDSGETATLAHPVGRVGGGAPEPDEDDFGPEEFLLDDEDDFVAPAPKAPPARQDRGRIGGDSRGGRNGGREALPREVAERAGSRSDGGRAFAGPREDSLDEGMAEEVSLGDMFDTVGAPSNRGSAPTGRPPAPGRGLQGGTGGPGGPGGRDSGRDRGDRGGRGRGRGEWDRDGRAPTRDRYDSRMAQEGRDAREGVTPAAPAPRVEIPAAVAFQVSVPAPRTRRVERRGDVVAAAPVATPVLPVISVPAPTPPEAANVAPVAAAPATRPAASKAKPVAAVPLALPKDLAETTVPGVFVLKKKVPTETKAAVPAPATPAAEAKAPSRSRPAAVAPKVEVVEPIADAADEAKKGTKRRAAAPARRATTVKKDAPVAEAPAPVTPTAAPAKVSRTAKPAATAAKAAKADATPAIPAKPVVAATVAPSAAKKRPAAPVKAEAKAPIQAVDAPAKVAEAPAKKRPTAKSKGS